jgi:hypothetical protein
MNKTPYLVALLILLGSACSASLRSIVPTISIGTVAPSGRVQTRVPSPLSIITATPTPTITSIPSAYVPTNATAAPPQATVQIKPVDQNALVPDSVSLTVSPAQWLGGSYYQLSGPTQASVFAPGAVVRVEFFTASTGTGATPQLEFTDTNGYDGWSWYWQTPRGGSHLWTEVVYANGARVSSPVLLILTNNPPPVTWLNYSNQAYLLEYPSNWTVDEAGLSQSNKEVLFSPPNPEPFLAYFSVSIDGRTLEQIQQAYAQQLPGVPPVWIDFAGQRALRYRFSDQRFEIYAPGYYGTFRFASDRATLPEVQHMLSSLRYIVPIGTVPPPPPTPTCETHTAAVQVQPYAQSVQVGQQLVVQVTLLNQGCVALGLPKYTLRVHAPQGQPLFNPPQPESVTHGLAVAPGQSDSVEFVLQAAQAGSGSLQADVSFEIHIGYPSPAYWGMATSGPINIAVTNALKPPDSAQPAAGICDPASGDVVPVNISADVPSPRCVKVTGQQRLQVVNATDATVQVQLAQFNVQLQPGQAQFFDASLGSYLAPGVHWLRTTGGNGPEIWLEGN